MTSFPISEAREAIGQIVNRVALRGERIGLSRNGKEVAVVVPLDDYRRLQQLEDEADVNEAERRMADASDKPIPFRRSR